MVAKKKICKGCKTDQYIWARGYCKLCSVKYPKDGNKVTKIAPLSDKRKKQNAEYLKLRLEFLNEHQLCQVKLPGCKIYASDVHHAQGRTGNLLVDVDNFVAICRPCHDYVELNPLWSKENGFSKNRI